MEKEGELLFEVHYIEMVVLLDSLPLLEM